MTYGLPPPAYDAQAFMDDTETLNEILLKGSSVHENLDVGYPSSASGHAKLSYSFMRRLLTSFAYFYRQHQQTIDLAVIFAVSLFTHLHKLEIPAMVCWDETHFGKHANHYLKRKFFFDVHPPLGKMTIALFGALSNYNGKFAFEKPGQPFGDTSYFGMRLLSALYGSMLSPLVYLSLKEMHFDLPACLLGAAFILFDNGLLTLTRYILLDAPLLFWTLFSFYTCLKFTNYRNYPFTGKWWVWLSLIGVGLAMACSVKLSGALIVALVGLTTVFELWGLYGDPRVSLWKLSQHFIARACCLILLPVMIYMFFFRVHFQVLNLSGEGDGFMSPEFQMTLKGNQLADSMQATRLSYEAEITLRSLEIGSGMLHSHKDLYPERNGNIYQQITAYSHNDNNNIWRFYKAVEIAKLPKIDYDSIKHMKEVTSYHAPPISANLQYVKDRDYVRLMHVNTGRNLHAMDQEGFVSKDELTVSGFGDHDAITDKYDIWEVVYVDKQGEPLVEHTEGYHPTMNKHWQDQELQRHRHIKQKQQQQQQQADDHLDIHSIKEESILAFQTYFKLYNPHMNCYLKITDEKYPKWGFEQQEVTCLRPNEEKALERSSVWMIMQIHDTRQPQESLEHLRKGFFSKFIELNQVMSVVNNRFKPDAGSSRPWMWPILYRGQVFTPFTDHDSDRVYLLGNPFIWYLNLVCLFVFVIQCVAIVVLLHRSKHENKHYVLNLRVRAFRVLRMGGWTFFTYLCHYAPYYFMSRVLYFHHYFPALMFSSILSAIVIDDLCLSLYNFMKARSRHSRKLYYILPMSLLVLACLVTFVLYLPIVYGMEGPKKDYHHLKLGRLSKHWDL